MNRKLMVLKQLNLFKTLPEEMIKYISEQFAEKEYNKRQVIFEPEDRDKVKLPKKEETMTKNKLNQDFAKLASNRRVAKVVKALEKNGIKAIVIENGSEAKKKVLSILPDGAEVFTMTSQTAEAISLAKEINESERFNSVRNKLMAMDRSNQGHEMQQLGSSPEFVIGSVHAITEKGALLIASNTGSQLSAEAYSGGKVIFVVGTQKIVKDTEEGLKRIYEYSYPLEDERAQKAYGMRSGVNKILIINKEVKPDRITVILVKEKLGF